MVAHRLLSAAMLQRRRQWLACPFFDVVFPWFTRSSSATTAIYSFICAYISLKRFDQFWSFKHHLTAFGTARLKILGCSDGGCNPLQIFKLLFFIFFYRCILSFGGWRNFSSIYWGVFVISEGSCSQNPYCPKFLNCIGVKTLDPV